MTVLDPVLESILVPGPVLETVLESVSKYIGWWSERNTIHKE